MDDLTRYTQPQKAHNLEQAAQKRRRPSTRVPRWPLIALGLLVGGVISQLMTSNWSLPEVNWSLPQVERLIADRVRDWFRYP